MQIQRKGRSSFDKHIYTDSHDVDERDLTPAQIAPDWSKLFRR